MLTKNDLQPMSAEQLGQLFDRMALEFYGSKGYAPRAAEDFGVSNNAVYRWRHNGPPWAVLYALDNWMMDPNGSHTFNWAAKTAIAALNRALEATGGAALRSGSDAPQTGRASAK
jgi:hypothetical protein